MKVTEINIYPIKSTRRIALDESEVQARGLAWDRRWMLVDDDGRFITARQQPALARVDTRIEGETLQVSVVGYDMLSLPLQAQAGDTLTVTVWRDTVQAQVVSANADAWFSGYLGLSCRLVRMPDSVQRAVDPDYGRAGDEVSFADGYPLLLIGEASLADLNKRLPQAVSMRRFRPNLVVDGAQAFAEDNWTRIRIGGVEFEGVKNCSRCIFTTIDPDTGVKDAGGEPLKTLSSFRRRAPSGVYFGQNLVPRGNGTLRIGDPVEILASDG